MNVFNFITMLGGLALFLYGMTLMGDGLSKVSGGRLEKILERLTSSPIKAVILGAAVTGVIQSSSATTVMVVGFVNAGIMRLSQAVGIIMGANIGTTVTSWILSLTGIQSDNFFLQFVKPATFSPILAIIAVFLLMFAKREKRKNIGLIIMGFAVLMIGMETMTSSIEPLSEMPAFRELLLTFSNPLYGMLAGLFVTAIVQSSSASVGILQALCATGTVSMGAAIPIIMGQNIGTCITAILSSIGANKGAKRAALVHLYFNVIGTVLFLAIFYGLNAVIHFSFLQNTASVIDIAIIHSLFNVAATVVLLPFSRGLEKLAYLTIPKEEEEKEATEEDRLEERFLETPSFATGQCQKVVIDMMAEMQRAFRLASELVVSYDAKKQESVLRIRKWIHMREEDVSGYLVQLSERELLEKDSRLISLLLHAVTDIKRIADYSTEMASTAKGIQSKKTGFSKKAKQDLESMNSLVKEMEEYAVEAFLGKQPEDIQKVNRVVACMEDLMPEMKKRHIKRLRNGKCTVRAGFLWQDILTNNKRIFDHFRNILVCTRQTYED